MNDKIIHLEISFQEFLWIENGVTDLIARWKLYLEDHNDLDDLLDLPALTHLKERLRKEKEEILRQPPYYQVGSVFI